MIEELMKQLGSEKVSMNETELTRHSQDESCHPGVEPAVICFPESRSDIEIILQIAQEQHVPVTAYGAGTGLEGGSIPVHGGIILNTERMKRIIDFSPEDFTVTVEPGVTRKELNESINKHGLMFPNDPGADASIGGMVSTNASGTTAVRYGSMREQILDLEVVLADGRVIHTGSRAKKSSSGYNLSGLIAGSEGTLGIVSSITLKLHGIPEHTIAARCTFPTAKACAEAARLVLLHDIPVMRLELVDAVSVGEVNRFGGYQFPEKHSLFFEFAGSKKTVEDEAGLVEELMRDAQCEDWEVAADSLERARIWKARHELSYAYRHTSGKEVLGGDVCVPVSRLPELVDYSRELAEDAHMKAGVFGHVGDGNFHTLIVYDPKKPEEQKKAEQILERLAIKAIDSGGTCTGEHGVGIGKKKFQKREHGEALEIMKEIKQLFDPDGILNPGKIFE
ncbi:FAD-binding oxidoreductase [Virgibacillus sediminis]|uniref:D-lactate dehydrogenase (cytochrome) n=1 Tax=Virgibacillus sediminis TaxID=202260 RepID=A0ABV7A9F7_9BACI